jgi:hypothetical protein
MLLTTMPVKWQTDAVGAKSYDAAIRLASESVAPQFAHLGRQEAMRLSLHLLRS